MGSYICLVWGISTRFHQWSNCISCPHLPFRRLLELASLRFLGAGYPLVSSNWCPFYPRQHRNLHHPCLLIKRWSHCRLVELLDCEYPNSGQIQDRLSHQRSRLCFRPFCSSSNIQCIRPSIQLRGSLPQRKRWVIKIRHLGLQSPTN